MGHLLGATPAAPNSCDVSPDRTGNRLWTYVDAVTLPPPDHRLAAFAIDTPRTSDRLPGAGLEINGWAIGRESPVKGIRVIYNGWDSKASPLDVRRPDVATDYPEFAHAAVSGFSFWAPLHIPATQSPEVPPLPSEWERGSGGEGSLRDAQNASEFQLTVESLLSDGTSTVLCEIHGHSRHEEHAARAGSRLVTAPDFAIIGTQRGGTTSLHAYLRAHPHVQTPATKELHFLTDRFARGRDWYLGQFPAEVPLGTITGEATPYALFHPAAPRRLHTVAPDAKLIVLLRNPVDRAYSHYLLETSRGHETLSFAEALAAEPSRLAGEEARLLADPTYVSAAHNHASYLSRGDYASQLARWFATFPQDQFLILRSEDLYERTAETFAQVTSFLGLPTAATIPFQAHNRTAGPPLDPTIRTRLAQHFAPLNENLAKLLGWKETWDRGQHSPLPFRWERGWG
jgi:hypothetical protein